MDAVQMKAYYGAISNYYFKIEQEEVVIEEVTEESTEA